jgi:uncharacterized protein (DUF983 family)
MEKSNFKLAALPAFIHGKCPRCRRGNIFVSTVKGTHSKEMNKICSHCGLTYDIKQGYSYLAVFMSFTMSLAEMVILATTIHILTESTDLWLYFMITVCIAILVSPFNFRYSKIVLLHWLMPGMRYDPEMGHDKTDQPF